MVATQGPQNPPRPDILQNVLRWGDPRRRIPQEASRTVTATRARFVRPGYRLCGTCLLPWLLTMSPRVTGSGPLGSLPT